MNTNKVCTDYNNTGKSVRFIFGLFIIMQTTFSCNLLDQPNTEDIINNITGTWKCSENSTAFGAQNYNVTISKTSEMTISIQNFFLNGITVDVEVEGYDLSIPGQTIGDYYIYGSGTIESGYKKINLTYSITDAGGTDNFTAVYIPK